MIFTGLISSEKLPYTVKNPKGEKLGHFEPWVYISALGLSEYVSDLYRPIIGGWLHLVLAAWLIFRGSSLHDQDCGKYYLMFSVSPFIRLISLATSPIIFSGVWFYAITEGLVLVFAVLTAQRIGLGIKDIGITPPRNMWVVPLTTLFGIVVGWVESHIVSAVPLTATLDWPDVWVPSLVLIVCTGFVEEVVFRGMVFTLALRLYSPFVAILMSTAGWTVLHIGWHSWKDLLLVFTTGLIWGWIRQFTKSVLPLVVSHGMANIMLFIVMPHL